VGTKRKTAERQAEQTAQISHLALRGGTYTSASTIVTLVLGLVRSILLARFLLPKVFGLAALAIFFTDLIFRLLTLDFDSAVIHHPQPNDRTLAGFMLLRVGFGSLAAVVAWLVAAPLGNAYQQIPSFTRLMTVLVGINLAAILSQVMEVLLRRAMAFKQLALINVCASLVMTIVAPWLAWRGAGVWALAAELGSGVAMRLILVWGVLRPWNPTFATDRATLRWYWRFSLPLWWNNTTTFLSERTNDYWVGARLGSSSLGAYVKSAEYGHYLRRVLAVPVMTVAQPLFARLQNDRLRLSQAFIRVTAGLLRLGGLYGVVAFSAAPWLIPLVLGEHWLVIVQPFRIFLLLALLDPLLAAGEGLLLAVGRTRVLAGIRILQLVVFFGATVLLVSVCGMLGAVVAVNIMSMLGAIGMLVAVRRSVDYSLNRLLGWPAAAVAAALLAGCWPELLSLTGGARLAAQPLWLGIVTTISAGLVYTAVLFTGEGRALSSAWHQLRTLWKGGSSAESTL